jgi:hypothetical protein
MYASSYSLGAILGDCKTQDAGPRRLSLPDPLHGGFSGCAGEIVLATCLLDSRHTLLT